MVCPPGVNTLRKRIYLAHYLCVLLERHHHPSQLPSSVGSLPSQSLCVNSQGQSEGDHEGDLFLEPKEGFNSKHLVISLKCILPVALPESKVSFPSQRISLYR